VEGQVLLKVLLYTQPNGDQFVIQDAAGIDLFVFSIGYVTHQDKSKNKELQRLNALQNLS